MTFTIGLESVASDRDRASFAYMGLAGTLLAILILSGGREALHKLDRYVHPPTLQRDAARLALGWDAEGEYMPRWVSDSGDGFIKMIASMGRVNADVGKIEVLRWAPRDILLGVDLPRRTVLIVKQFYFPGWNAIDARTGERLSISPNPKTGLLTLNAPAGRYQLVLRLEPLWQERVGWALTIVTVLVSLVMMFHHTLASRDHRASSDQGRVQHL